MARPRCRGVRYLEGPHRQRQPAGREPDQSGAQHRPGDHGGGQGRPFQQDHGGSARRAVGAEEHRQHHGRPAVGLRLRSDQGGPGSGHRRQVGRPGPGARGLGNVAGPDRLGQLHGGQPDRPGAQHRPGDHGRGPGRPVPEDHRGRPRRDPRSSKTPSTRWSTSSRPLPPRSPGWPGKWAPKASWAARPRWPRCQVRGGA